MRYEWIQKDEPRRAHVEEGRSKGAAQDHRREERCTSGRWWSQVALASKKTIPDAPRLAFDKTRRR